MISKVSSPQIIFPQPIALGHRDVGDAIVHKCDVAIIGAGAGGAAAAKVLTDAGISVLVIESGPAQSRFRSNYAHTAKYHMQENGAMVARGAAMMPIAAGKGVGGSTLINSALSFRAPESVLNHWAELLQDDRWSAENMNSIYSNMEKIIGVSATRAEIAGANNKLIVRGIETLGYEGGFAPRSTPGCVGCGVCYYGCPSNGKASTNLTFLPKAVKRGTVIQAETEITKFIVKDKRVIGIHGHARNPDTGEITGKVEVRAEHTLCCAGAIGTPKLFHRSGLVRHLSSHCGKGLKVHPGSTLIGISHERIELWKGATQGAYYHPPNLPGVLPHSFSAPPEACLVAAGFIGSQFSKGWELLPHLCGMLVMVSDQGTGSVSSNKDGSAKIHYDFNPQDVQRIKDGLVSVAEVLLEGGAYELRAPIHGVKPFSSPAELRAQLKDKHIHDFTLYAAHPMGTCKLGINRANGVASSTGKCFGLEGISVADASVFPSSLGVNPQPSTMAAATVISTALRDELSI